MLISDAIKYLAIKGEEIYLVQGRVITVDDKARVCTVKPIDGSAEIHNCLLQGAYGYAKGFVLVPKKDSKVIVGFLSPHEAAVLLTSEIEKIQLTTTSDSLQKLLLDLCAAIEQLTVSTPAGPSGTPLPPTIQAIENLKQRIKNFLIE